MFASGYVCKKFLYMFTWDINFSFPQNIWVKMKFVKLDFCE